MFRKSEDRIDEQTKRPSFVEEAHFSGARIGEAIDWVLARQDREIHCEIQGALVPSGAEIRFQGRLLTVKKGVLSKLMAILVEEDISRSSPGIDLSPREDDLLIEEGQQEDEERYLDSVLTVGSENTSPKDVLPRQITLRNYLKRDLNDDLFFTGSDLQQAVKEVEKVMKEHEIECTVWGKRASDKTPVTVKGTLVGAQIKPAPILLEGILEVRVESMRDAEASKIYLVVQPQFLIGPRTDPEATIQAEKVYIRPFAWKETPVYKNVIEARDLTVTVSNGMKLIENVSFSLKEGEMLAIIGESGAGKSTTIKALIGDIPSTGVARIAGVDSRNAQAVRYFFGYCPQDLSYMYETFTPLENIIAFGKQYNIPEYRLIKEGKTLLRDFGILEKANSPTSELSGGQQRRVSIAIALVHRPKVLLMDEPTSGLDPDNRNELWHFLDYINHEYGTSMVVITHYPVEAEFCDKVAVFMRGRSLVSFGSPSQLKQTMPNKGFAVGIVLEEVDPRARRVLESVEGILFVLQRGELLKVFTEEPLQIIAESALRALEEQKIAVKIVKTKSVADMVDYYIAITRGLINGFIEK